MENKEINGSVSVSNDANIGGDVLVQGIAHLKGGLKVDGVFEASNIKGLDNYLGYFYGVGEALRKIQQPKTGMFFVNGETNSIWVWDALTRMWIDTNRVDSGMKGMLNDKEGNSPSDYVPSPKVGVKESYFYVAACDDVDIVPNAEPKTITFTYFKNGASAVSVTVSKTSIISLFWNGDYWETSVVPMNVNLGIYAKETYVNQKADELRGDIQNAINDVKSVMAKSFVSDREDFNNIVKELYFDKYCSHSNLASVGIKRNGSSSDDYELWELYFIDNNGTHHWASFGKNAEDQDVNVARIGWEDDKVSLLFPGVEREKVLVYAVIDWDKVTDQHGGIDSDIFSPIALKGVNYAKFFPQINNCIAIHKYFHDAKANNIIKELYFENLIKGGVPISDWYFENEFSLERIDRCAEDNGKYLWQLVFNVKNENGTGHFYIYCENSPENKTIWKGYAESIVGDITYSGTVYAVIDWDKIALGDSVVFGGDYLLRGCLNLYESPIISDSINYSLSKIEWGKSSNLNNLSSSGEYEITGSREQGWLDNMPIISGGELHARLSVFANGDYISQFIRFDNIGGGDCNLYTRVCQNGVWENWQKLQTNIEVNAIGVGQEKTFNDLTDNGIYSGVNVYWIDQANYLTSFETFVLVVINAYLTGGGVSQLKYSTLVDGTTTVMTRTMINGQWSEWKSVGGSENESILLSGAGTFQIDGDKIKTIYLTSVGPGIGYYNITVTKSTIIDVVLFDTAYDRLHFDVNGSGRYTPTGSNQAGMYRLAINMASKTLMVSAINNDMNINRF